MPEQVSWSVDLRTVATWNASRLIVPVSVAAETRGFTARLADSISWSVPYQPLLSDGSPHSISAFWDTWAVKDAASAYLSRCTLSQNQRSCTQPSLVATEISNIDRFTPLEQAMIRISTGAGNATIVVHLLTTHKTGIVSRKCELPAQSSLLAPRIIGSISTFESEPTKAGLLGVLFVLVSTNDDKNSSLISLKLAYQTEDASAGLSCELQDLSIPEFISAHQQRGFGSPKFLILNSSGLHTLAVGPRNASDPMSAKILTLHTVLTNKAWDPSALLYCVTGSTIYYSVDRSGVVQCYDSSPQCRLPYRLGLPSLRYLLQAACHPDHGFAAIGLFGNQTQQEVRGVYSPDPRFQTQDIQIIRSQLLTSLLQSAGPEADFSKLNWSISFLASDARTQFADHLAQVVFFERSLRRAVVPMSAHLVITSKPQASKTTLILKLDYLSPEASTLQTHRFDLALPSHDPGSKLSAESADCSFSPELSQDLSLRLVRQQSHIQEVSFAPVSPSIKSLVQLTQRWSGVASPGYLTETDDQQQIEDVSFGPSISVVLLKDKTTGLYTLRLYQVSPEYPDQASLITSYQPADSHDPLLPHSSARLAAAAFSPKRLNQTIAPDTREFQVAVAAQDRYDTFAVHNFVFLVKSVAGRLSVTGASQIQKAHFEERLGDVRALRVEIGALDPSEDTSFLFPLVFYLSPSRALKIRSYRGVRLSFDEVAAYHYVVLQPDPSAKPVLVLVLLTSNHDIRVLSVDYRRGSGFKPSTKEETVDSPRVTKWELQDSCYLILLKAELQKFQPCSLSRSASLLECRAHSYPSNVGQTNLSTCIFAASSAIATVLELNPHQHSVSIRSLVTFPKIESRSHIQVIGAFSSLSRESSNNIEFVSVLRQVSPLERPRSTSLSLGYFTTSPDIGISRRECGSQEGYLSGLHALRPNVKAVKGRKFAQAAQPYWSVSCFYGGGDGDSPTNVHARTGHEFFSLRYSTTLGRQIHSTKEIGLKRPHNAINLLNASAIDQQNTTAQLVATLLNSSLIIGYSFGVLQRSTVAELIGEPALRWLHAHTHRPPTTRQSADYAATLIAVGGLLGLLLAFGLCFVCRLRPKQPCRPAPDAEEELSLSLDRSALVGSRGPSRAIEPKPKSA